MKVKTSVTIDEHLLRAIDKATSRDRSRSRVIEEAAREYLARRARTAGPDRFRVLHGRLRADLLASRWSGHAA
jgi:metal-responsive CopG/Arc/MetJ family transcriptional regulator